MNKYLRYALTVVVMLILAFLIALSMSIFSKTEAIEVIKILCDAFTIIGICYFSLGLLTFVANEGFFDIFGFGFELLFAALKTDPLNRKHRSLYDYRMEKHDKKRPYAERLIIGGIFIGIGVIFLIIYFSLEKQTVMTLLSYAL